MMETTPEDHRHAAPAEPSSWVARFAPLAPLGRPVLDLACGSGRHGRLFLEHGHPVVFLDRAVDGVHDLAGRGAVEILEADLEAAPGWPFADRRFGAVIVTNYLWRPLLPRLAGAIEQGGLLIYETFGRGNEAFSRPRNPDHLLRPGELLEAFAGPLQVVAYECGIRRDPAPRVVQRIAAVNRTDPVELSP